MTQPSFPFTPEDLPNQTGALSALARTLLRDEHEVEDVSQETWLAVLQHPVSRVRCLGPWLACCARNFARRMNRSNSRRIRRERSVAKPETVPSCAEVAERVELQRQVIEAVQALSEPYRTAVMLRFWEDLPPRRIAERLQVPVATVRTRLRRATILLRADLDRDHGGRSAWATLLGPWADGVGLSAATTSAGARLLFTGVLLMTTKAKIAAVAAAVIATVLLTWAAAFRHGGLVGARDDLAMAVSAEAVDDQGAEAASRSAATGVGPERSELTKSDLPARSRVLRGTIREVDGHPCGRAPICRAVRTPSQAYDIAVPEAAWCTVLGVTALDGSFEISLDPPLGPDEWVEFRLCGAAFARYRPDRTSGERTLIVPRLIETQVAVVGLPSGEEWSLETHAAERKPDGGADLRAQIDLALGSPAGELVLRCHYCGWSARQGCELRVQLAEPVAWSFGVRAARHGIEEAFRIGDAGARVVFHAAGLEQRILVEVVDDVGRVVSVGGRVDVSGEKGYSVGELVDGRVELRPPFMRRIEGDLSGTARLDDGETFELRWPEEVWTAASSLRLRRGDGRPSIEINVPGVLNEMRALGVDGSSVPVNRIDPPWVDGTWWEPLAKGHGVRVNLPAAVRRLWCVGRRDGEGRHLGRVGVAERTGVCSFEFRWRAGRLAEIGNRIPVEGLRAVIVEALIPGLPRGEHDNWLALLRVDADDLTAPLRVIRPEGLEIRLRINRAAEGRRETTTVSPWWR